MAHLSRLNWDIATCIYRADAHCCPMGTAIKHPVADQVKPSFVIFDASKKTREGAFSYPGPNRSYPVSKVRRIPGSVAGPKQSELYSERQVGVGWTPCINYEWTRPRPLSPRVVDLNQCGRGVSRGCRGMTSVVCI